MSTCPAYWLNANKSLVSVIHKIIADAMAEFCAGALNIPTDRDPKAVIVCVTLRFESDLNLNPHINSNNQTHTVT